MAALTHTQQSGRQALSFIRNRIPAIVSTSTPMSRPSNHQLPHISLSRPNDCLHLHVSACIPVSTHTLLLPSDHLHRKISRRALVYTRIDTATVIICTALLPSHIPLRTPTVVSQQTPMSHLAVHWRPLLSHIIPRSNYLQRVPDVRHLHAFHITNKQPSMCVPHTLSMIIGTLIHLDCILVTVCREPPTARLHVRLGISNFTSAAAHELHFPSPSDRSSQSHHDQPI
jgi:hypothetical protein